jgi:hypothetical protein
MAFQSFASIERHYADRVLSIDLETCRLGDMTAGAQKTGAMASTSLPENTADFEPTTAWRRCDECDLRAAKPAAHSGKLNEGMNLLIGQCE